MSRRFTFRRPFDVALRQAVSSKQRATVLYSEAYINEASGAITNGDDTTTSTVVNVTVASLNRTEFADVVTATTENTTIANLSVVNTDDSVSTTVANVTAAQASITEQSDTANSTTTITVLVSGSVTEAADTASASTTNVTVATSAITETLDLMVSTVINLTYASGTVTEKADTTKFKGWADGIDVTGRLDDGAASISAQMLIDAGLGTAPSAAQAWPIYISSEPEKPDNCIVIFDTAAVDQGRYMKGGKRVERKGFQFLVRSADYETGYLKAHALAVALDESIRNTTVTIGPTTYDIAAFSRTSGVLHLGRDKDNSRREHFSINATASINQVV